MTPENECPSCFSNMSVDYVVPERPGWLEDLAGVIAEALDVLLQELTDVRRARRRQRIRTSGLAD